MRTSERRAWLSLILYMGAVLAWGCTRERPEPVVLVAETGERLDPETSESVVDALDELKEMSPEPPSEADKAGAKDASKLVGVWEVHRIFMTTNGKSANPGKPLVPTTWTFTANGKMTVEGAQRMALSYVYTGDRLIITGFGPKQEHHIEKLTASELDLVMSIVATESLNIESTTALKRR